MSAGILPPRVPHTRGRGDRRDAGFSTAPSRRP